MFEVSSFFRIDVVRKPQQVNFAPYAPIEIMRLLQIMFATTLLLLFGCSVRQDELDAERAAERIHSQVKSHDFQSIYRESGDSFKEAGDESKFVTAMQQNHEAVGSLKNATPIAYQSVLDSNVGAKHVLIFNLEFERGRGKEQMVLTRSKDGKMHLWDLTIDPME